MCGWFCTQRSDVVGTDQPYCSKDVEWRGEAGIGNDFLTSVPCERASERASESLQLIHKHATVRVHQHNSE